MGNSLDRRIGRIFTVFIAAVALGSCGSPSSPSGSTGSTDAGITVTLSSTGASPKPLQVAQGTSVTFVNGDSRAHTMNSDPHPEHTDCVELNTIGFISAGQKKQTGNLNTVRTCGYHDHDAPDDARFQGSIIIH